MPRTRSKIQSIKNWPRLIWKLVNLQIHAMRANQYICIFSQFSEFRIQNMHSTFICVFSVDFQKHASEYEIAGFWKLTENTHIKWNAYSEFWILKIDREYTYQYHYIGGMQIARGAHTGTRIPVEDCQRQIGLIWRWLCSGDFSGSRTGWQAIVLLLSIFAGIVHLCWNRPSFRMHVYF